MTLFCCQSIQLALNPQNGDLRVYFIENASESFYERSYSTFKESIFLSQTNPEIIVETCLVALTTISYILPRRVDLVPVFEEVLAINIDRLIGDESSILLQARMSLLLGYYADMLFIKFEQAFLKSINFLIRSVALTGDRKVVAIQSADTLSTIVSDKDLIPRIEPYLPTLIPVLN